jgi:mannose-6-phosphate isomerase-like protein (cupin superfamily)
MLKFLTFFVAVAGSLFAAASFPPSAYVTTAEVQAALKEMQPDKTVFDKVLKTVDEGDYKVSVVILRRVPKAGVEESGLSHDRVTEVYLILTGSGIMETGGSQVDTSPTDLTLQAAGPSTRGKIVGGKTQKMAPGDTVVILPKVPHRFSHLDGTITYMVTRIEAKGK